MCAGGYGKATDLLKRVSPFESDFVASFKIFKVIVSRAVWHCCEYSYQSHIRPLCAVHVTSGVQQR